MATRFSHAVVRQPASTQGEGLTGARLGAPDVDLARRQFDAYVDALTICGLTVEILDPMPDFPDAHFVEDAAVVVPEVAVITRPGADARRGETAHLESALAAHRPLHRIAAPGILDGGDVLMAGETALIGISERTDPEGARQLGELLAHHGHGWRTVPVGAGLHLKSSVNLVDEGVLLVSPAFATRPELDGFQRLVVPAGEEYACNVLLVNEHLLVPAGYPGTRDLLAPLGHEIIELDTSEFRKMDGGLTCLSLRF